MSWKVQAVVTGVIWVLIVAAVGLPLYMAPLGVPFAVAFAWWDEVKHEADLARFSEEGEDEIVEDDRAILWL